MPERTAITNGVSYSAKRLIQDSKGFGVVLDYGSGKLRNSRYLHNQGMVVDTLDTLEQISSYQDEFIRNLYSTDDHVTEKYDYILCSFVLNVIPDAETRKMVVGHIKELLTDDGFAYVEVRSDDKISQSKTAMAHNDGYILGSGEIKTFQKKMDLDEIVGYTSSVELEVVESKKLSASCFIKLQR